MTKRYTLDPRFVRHGGAYDRGSADRYYGRPFDPHYYTGPTYQSERVAILPDTEEYAAYKAGYDEQQDTKNWG